MHFGTFFYGTVDMPDAGIEGPPAHQRWRPGLSYSVCPGPQHGGFMVNDR